MRPIIYTGPYFWRDQVLAPSYGADYPLWIAHFTNACPLTPEPWSQWAFHQFTGEGLVNGIVGPVDRSVFNGSEAALAAMAVASSASQPEACTSNASIGAACAEGCVWSGWAVSQGIQPATHTCGDVECACVQQGQAHASCVPTTCDALNEPPGPVRFEILAPADGALIANPVGFVFDVEGVALVDVYADNFLVLSFDPAASGTAFKPMISTGVDGPADLSLAPCSSVMARTRP